MGRDEGPKSVFEKLDEIKEAVERKEELRPLSISEMIGEDFKAFVEDCEFYFYEADRAQFEAWKKPRLIRIAIASVFQLAFLVATVVFCFLYRHLFWYINLIPEVLLSAFVALKMISIIRAKPKIKAKSKWNERNAYYFFDENGRFYVKKINGSIGYVHSVLFWLGFVAVFAPFLLWLIGGYTFDEDIVVNVLVPIFLTGQIFPPVTVFGFTQYFYRDYIFEKPDRYVVLDGNGFKLVRK